MSNEEVKKLASDMLVRYGFLPNTEVLPWMANKCIYDACLALARRLTATAPKPDCNHHRVFPICEICNPPKTLSIPSDAVSGETGTLGKIDAKDETLPPKTTPSTGSDAPHTRAPRVFQKLRHYQQVPRERNMTSHDAPHSETVKTAPNNITITDRVSLRVDPNNPDHPMGCDDETMPGAYGKSPALKDYKQGYRDGLEQGLFDGKMDRQRADFAESKLEQLESIVRRFAKLPINDTCAVQSDADKLRDLIRRSRELTQPK